MLGTMALFAAFAAGGGVATPVLTSLNYDLADTAGGDAITITGTDLGSASDCEVDNGFGGAWQSASITANTATSLTFTMPATLNGAGSYLVRVTTAGGVSNTLAIEAWSPAELDLNIWNRADFASSPWAGETSLGDSGSNDLTEATNPPAVGSAINGFDPADFDGTNDKLENASTMGTLFSTAYSFFALVKADALAADDSGGDVQPRIFGDSLSYLCLIVSTSGAKLYTYSGAIKQTAYSAMSTGTWTLLRGKWDGTYLYLAKDSAAFAAGVSAGIIDTTAGTLRVGCNYNASAFFNGQIAELAFSPTDVSDANFTKIRKYLNARFALSL